MEYELHGPENADEWLLWIDDRINNIKKGKVVKIKQRKVDLDDRDSAEKIYPHTSRVKINGEYVSGIVYEYVVEEEPPETHTEFLDLCAQSGLVISNTDAFLKVYWDRAFVVENDTQETVVIKDDFEELFM